MIKSGSCANFNQAMTKLFHNTRHANRSFRPQLAFNIFHAIRPFGAKYGSYMYMYSAYSHVRCVQRQLVAMLPVSMRSSILFETYTK